MTWHPLGPSDGFPEGVLKTAPAPGIRAGLIVVRSGGTLRALRNECPHAGKPLDEGEVKNGCITCPWHAYRYNLKNGRNVDDTDEMPAKAYPVRETDGQVEVELP